jgi:pyridoxine/pyridoxamine 5'-phosphate oxidase
MCNQISACFYWSSTDTQIRMKAYIEQTPKEYNQAYFVNRDKKKNALAIMSKQSNSIHSYESLKNNYEMILENNDLTKCPDYWGGFSFIPFYFEFWEGHESRINKREVFNKIDDTWEQSFLQP